MVLRIVCSWSMCKIVGSGCYNNPSKGGCIISKPLSPKEGLKYGAPSKCVQGMDCSSRYAINHKYGGITT